MCAMLMLNEVEEELNILLHDSDYPDYFINKTHPDDYIPSNHPITEKIFHIKKSIIDYY
jgi:hypothetical protein